MELQSLKKIIGSALDLETAIHTQTNIIEQYTREREALLPQEAVLQLPQKPTSPKLKSTAVPIDVSNVNIFKIGTDGDVARVVGNMLAFIATWILGLVFMSNGNIVIGLAMFIVGAFLAVRMFKLRKEIIDNFISNYKSKIHKENQAIMQKHQNELDAYRKKENALMQEYNNCKIAHQIKVQQHNAKTLEVLSFHKENLRILEISLKNLYSNNVIYPKYRNIVALSSIKEYLDSGRCLELEGPNGAYNLFESELRQNIIINSLAQVLSNITQVRENQYLLYQQLSNSNKVSKDILLEMRLADNDIKQTNFFAETAMLTSSADQIS